MLMVSLYSVISGALFLSNTSNLVRITARGVLSSWAALAENCLWARKVSPSLFKSLLKAEVSLTISTDLL